MGNTLSLPPYLHCSDCTLCLHSNHNLKLYLFLSKINFLMNQKQQEFFDYINEGYKTKGEFFNNIVPNREERIWERVHRWCCWGQRTGAIICGVKRSNAERWWCQLQRAGVNNRSNYYATRLWIALQMQSKLNFIIISQNWSLPLFI